MKIGTYVLVIILSIGFGCSSMDAMQRRGPQGGLPDFGALLGGMDQLEQVNQLPDKMHTTGTALIEKAQSSLMSVVVATGCMIVGAYAAYRGLHSVLDKSLVPLKRFGLGFGLMSMGLAVICTSPFVGRKICGAKKAAK